MKIKCLFNSLAIALALGFNVSCSKEDAPAPAASQPVNTATPPVVDASKEAADKATAARIEGEKAAQALKDQAEAAKKAAADKQAEMLANVSKIQDLIDTARKLSSENKWSEAMKIINDLAAQKLTPEQQTIVDGLKQQAQKQIQQAAAKKATSEAEKAIGGLLKSNSK